MNQPTPTSPSGMADQAERKPGNTQMTGKPAFGFLLGGTTLGIFIGCVLLCAGAKSPEVILILLSIIGAIIGGILEALWPNKVLHKSHVPRTSPLKTALSNYECNRCGEIFPPDPVTCPMCGHTEKRK